MEKLNVKVISREMIKPSSPTPPHLRTYKISLIDQLAHATCVPVILFYPALTADNSSGENATFPGRARFDTFKKALSETLSRFYPLAGRFVKQENSVNCNDEGAEYLEAHVDGDIAPIVEKPEAEFLGQLLPCKHDRKSVPASNQVQLAVQVNHFNCGGVLVGLHISHKIADGASSATLLKCWAAIARNGGSGEAVSLYPSYEAAGILPARALSPAKDQKLPSAATPRAERTMVARRFVFHASAMATLKAKATKDDDQVPTRVGTVIALLWKSLISVAREKLFLLGIAVNLRGRMDPPLPDYSFGNVTKCAMVASDDDDDVELHRMVTQVRDAINKIDDEYARKTELFMGIGALIHEPFTRLFENAGQKEIAFVPVASWCRFPFYETDFGWGRPIWVTYHMVPTLEQFVLLDTPDGGGVEAWVSLEEQDMIKFEKYLLDLLA